MLFEQAFMSLPEFLTATPFQRYQFEGTVVTAFSMAVLQELNSRNVPNPVSLLRSEVEYQTGSSQRADLHINVEELGLLNDSLRSYGYYENNWLEAKFYRLTNTGQPAVPLLVSTVLLLKDLIRLCSLVPDTAIPGTKSSCGRYLLHAYQRDPRVYFNHTRNQHGRRVERSWIGKLLEPGRQNIQVNDLAQEKTKTFTKHLGQTMGLIKIDASISNIVHQSDSPSDETYYIVLTRIDDFKVSVGRRWFKREAGLVSESSNSFGLLLPRLVNHIMSK